MNITEGDRVTINKPGMRQHGITGVVFFIDNRIRSTPLYLVEVDSGGTSWHVWYKAEELIHNRGTEESK